MAKDAGLKIYFRTTPKLRGCYNRLTGAIRATEVIASKKGYTSNDAIINALLLWAADRDPEALAHELGSYLAHFEAIWDEVLAQQGAARSDAAVSAGAPPLPESEPRQDPEPPPVASSEASEWVTGGIRHRTDGDNAKMVRRHRSQREGLRTASKEEETGESESESAKRKRKGKSST